MISILITNKELRQSASPWTNLRTIAFSRGTICMYAGLRRTGLLRSISIYSTTATVTSAPPQKPASSFINELSDFSRKLFTSSWQLCGVRCALTMRCSGIIFSGTSTASKSALSRCCCTILPRRFNAAFNDNTYAS